MRSIFRFPRRLHMLCLQNLSHRSLTHPIRTSNLLPCPLLIALLNNSLPLQPITLLSRSNQRLLTGFVLIRRRTEIPKGSTNLLLRSLMRTPRHPMHGGFLDRRGSRLFPAIRDDTALLSILGRHSPEFNRSGRWRGVV